MYLPRPFAFVPFDRVNTTNLLAFVFDSPIKVIFGLEVFLDDIKIGVCLVDTKSRRKISSLQINNELALAPESQ